MPAFSITSASRRDTCHPDLRAILDAAISTAPSDLDFTVLCGSRSRADQDLAYRSGASRARWPDSAHNVDGVKRRTSWAVDLAPYPIDWQDIARFKRLRAHVEATAARLLAEGTIRHSLKPLLYLGRGRTKPDHPHYELSGVQSGE